MQVRRHLQLAERCWPMVHFGNRDVKKRILNDQLAEGFNSFTVISFGFFFRFLNIFLSTDFFNDDCLDFCGFQVKWSTLNEFKMADCFNDAVMISLLFFLDNLCFSTS